MIEETDSLIKERNENIEEVRNTMAKIDKEISDSGSTIANLRENIRVRKIEKDIQRTREEIATYDMEEAAKAKRNFDSKWDVAKKTEDELKAAVNQSISFKKALSYIDHFASTLKLMVNLYLSSPSSSRWSWISKNSETSIRSTLIN
jgi:hypothetical protein